MTICIRIAWGTLLKCRFLGPSPDFLNWNLWGWDLEIHVFNLCVPVWVLTLSSYFPRQKSLLVVFYDYFLLLFNIPHFLGALEKWGTVEERRTLGKGANLERVDVECVVIAGALNAVV